MIAVRANFDGSMDEPKAHSENHDGLENIEVEDAFLLDDVEVVEESDSDSKNLSNASSDNKQLEKSSVQPSTKVLRKRNNRRTKNNGTFICAVCEKVFSLKIAVLAHITKSHRFSCTEDGFFTCNVCGEAFRIKSDLKRHHKLHAQTKTNTKRNESFQCETCKIEFKHKYEFNVHLKTIHKRTRSSDVGEITFHNLRSRQLRQNYLKNVIQSVTKSSSRSVLKSPAASEESKAFLCSNCGCGFSKKCILKEHIEKQHSMKGTLRKMLKCFECAECGKKFTQKYNLVVHLKTIHKQTFLDTRANKPFLCTHCGKKFALKHTLKIHIRSFHQDVILEPDKNKNFACFACCRRFSQKYNLKVHLQTIHKITDLGPKKEKPFMCSICEKRFGRKHTLKVHFSRIHGQELEPKKEKKFSCPACHKSFSRKPNLVRHFTQAHRHSPGLECLTCGKKFVTEEEIRIHVEKCSRKQALQTLKFERAKNRVILQTVVCALCKLTLHKVADMRRHYQNEHSLNMSLQTLTFFSDEEFLEWKYAEETNNRCSYSRYRSYKIQKAKYVDFFCSRSGFYKDKNQGLRGRRAIGSKKINACCPAQIKVKYLDNQISVKYLPTHVGHDNKLCYMNLTKIERQLIVEELRKGMAPQEILQKIKYPLPASEDERRKIHLLTVQDIRNIAVNAGIDYKKGRFREEKSVGSVEAWVNDNLDSVLYYKAKGQLDESFPTLKEEDFVLVIMTEKQRQKLERLGDNVVLVDSAHGSEKNNYLLTTLMVLDLANESYPCCFMFSNRLNDKFLAVFYQCVRMNVCAGLAQDRGLHVKTFMSAPQDYYYKSWTKVFPEPQFRLFCPWHVLKNWRDNLNKISLSSNSAAGREDGEVIPEPLEKLRQLKSRIYKFLKYDLMEQRDRHKFDIELTRFLQIDNPALRSFLAFFQAAYVTTKEMWACCYREEAGLKPNAFTESFQKILKYQHSTGNKVCQLDQALAAVVSYLERKDEAEIMREEKGAQDLQRLRTLRRRHINSLKGDKLSIMAFGPNEWIVPSGSSKPDEMYEYYYIRKCDNKCVDCYLVCRECGVCLHDFECTCTDYCVFNNMCKHIHLLCQSKEILALDGERMDADDLQVHSIGVEEQELELEDEEVIFGFDDDNVEVEYEIVNTADLVPMKEQFVNENENGKPEYDEAKNELVEVISEVEKCDEVKEQFNKVISGISSPQILNVAKKWVQQFSSIISACERQGPADISVIEKVEEKPESCL